MTEERDQVTGGPGGLPTSDQPTTTSDQDLAASAAAAGATEQDQQDQAATPSPTEPAPAPAPAPAAEPAAAPAAEPTAAQVADMDMDQLMAAFGGEAERSPDLRTGDLITGTVVQVSESEVMIDVGGKSEGKIPREEFGDLPADLKAGDQLRVVVIHVDREDIILSKRQADLEAAWEELAASQGEEKVIEARVVDAVKGGLLVDLGPFGQGFVPASHVSLRRPRNLNTYIDQVLRLQVIEVERRRRRVVLSRRLVLEREQAGEREETLVELREGQVRHGVVRRLTEFGAFVDLGGVDGLLHVSELSWKRVESPRDQLHVGQELDVMVLRLDRDQHRISLGRRQLLADPWRDIPRLYREGTTARGTITEFSPDGTRALVALPLGWDVEIEIPEEQRPLPSSEPAAAAPAEPVESAESAEAGEPTAAAESVDEAAAQAPVASEPEADAAPSTDAPAAEAADAASPRLSVGAEVEVRIERMNPPERELFCSLASARAAVDRERGRGRLADGDRGRAPLARGRYSDRREEQGEGQGAEQRPSRERRERRRDRDSDRDYDRVAPEHMSTAPIRRTLGDLMGDRLRALIGGGDDEPETTEEPAAPAAEDAAAPIEDAAGAESAPSDAPTSETDSPAEDS